MKKIGLLILFPAGVAIGCLLLVFDRMNAVVFKHEKQLEQPADVRYIDNFQHHPYFEDDFLASNDSSETIFLLGSSELTTDTPAMPFNFITEHFKTRVVAVGHAGNQCFSIYSQLLANEHKLKDAPVVIMLSPGWFDAKYSTGTSSTLFLEFNSDYYLNNIFQHTVKSEFRDYGIKRISDLFHEIINPDLTTKLMFYEEQSNRSIVHKIAYSPLIMVDGALNDMKFRLLDGRTSYPDAFSRKPIIAEPVVINWDSLLTASQNEQLKNASNNTWYIENSYYSEYVKGEQGVLEAAPGNSSQELEDFKMLVKFLKARGVNASFVIMPLNPYFYGNIRIMDPVVTQLRTELKASGFPCLDLWTSDKASYDKGVLRDVMHLGDYGWYQVNKFIADTYNLQK